ncbi:hypothetical protein AAMO2058_001079700 [Amorphochlora amoebiformis]
MRNHWLWAIYNKTNPGYVLSGKAFFKAPYTKRFACVISSLNPLPPHLHLSLSFGRVSLRKAIAPSRPTILYDHDSRRTVLSVRKWISDFNGLAH